MTHEGLWEAGDGDLWAAAGLAMSVYESFGHDRYGNPAESAEEILDVACEVEPALRDAVAAVPGGVDAVRCCIARLLEPNPGA